MGFSTFARKKPDNVIVSNKQKWYSCLCEYCTNVDLTLKALNKFAKSVKIETNISDRYAAISVTLCSKDDQAIHHRRECIERKCGNCRRDLLLTKLSNLLERHVNEEVEYVVWGKQEAVVNRKGQKNIKNADGEEKNIFKCYGHPPSRTP